MILAEWLIFLYFLLVNTFYGILLLSAIATLRRHMREIEQEPRWRLLGSEMGPRISLLAPAYNEETTVVESVRAFLNHHYPNLEVVVVSDGSKDRTIERLVQEWEMVPVEPIYRRRLETQALTGMWRSATVPNLLVVDKVNGGKADALNLALQVASGELVCAMDADTLLEPDALQRMVRPFLSRTDLVAAGGTIRPVNACRVDAGRVVDARVPRDWLAGFQVVEYARAFLFGRLGWNRLGGNLIISGAFGVFRRETVIETGGYAHGSVGEDMELVVRLRRRGYETGGPTAVDFVPDPVAWTEVPESSRVLGRQRDRWHRGLCDTLWRHRKLFLNPRYGSMGLLGYPYFVAVELLAPVVEALGLGLTLLGVLLGALNWPFAALFFLVAYGYGLVLTLAALALDEFAFPRYRRARDLVRLIFYTVAENLGYRQMTVWWRLKGIWGFLRGNRQWGAMQRKGFTQKR